MIFHHYISVFFSSLFVSSTLIPIILYICHKRKWYDFTDKRKIHAGDIPRLGGVGIFWGFLISSLFILFFVADKNFAKSNILKLILIFMSCILIHIIGLLDDFKNLRARYKMLGQLFLSIILVELGFSFHEIVIPFTGLIIKNVWFCKIVSVFWIVGISNAMNLIDGIDGLSSVVTFIAALLFAGINLIHHDYLTCLLSVSLMGAILGFFIYNKPKGKIFMGDSGSLFIGFLLAILPLINIYPSEQYVLESSITILIIPISDTLFAMARRMITGKKFSCPDKEHLHHILLDLGNTNWEILRGVGGLTFLFGIFSFDLALSKEYVPASEVTKCHVIWVISFFFIYFLHKTWKRKNKRGAI